MVALDAADGGRLGRVDIEDHVIERARQRHAERAEPLIGILAAVQSGELTAEGPAAVALARRLEGVVLALAALNADA
jgi:hypothetical protein